MQPARSAAATEEGAPPRASGGAPQRRCLVTRLPAGKAELIRFVVDPGGELVPDLAGDLPGRGLWTTADRRVLGRAVAKNLFARAAKAPVKVAPDLPERVAVLLRRRLLDLLGLAKRAGRLVSGFEKVESRLRAGRVAYLIEAADARPDGRAKLAKAAGPGVEIWQGPPAAELAAALGVAHAVHVAVAPGPLAARLREALRRHAGFLESAAAAAEIWTGTHRDAETQ